jgi:hypothetical protein
MLSKFKVELMCVLAAFAFVAVALPSASAVEPKWLVNGTKTTSSSLFTVAQVAILSIGNSITYNGGEAELKCAGVEVQSDFIKGEKEGGSAHVVFTGCVNPRPAPCVLASGLIRTTEVRVHLSSGEPAEVTIEPLNGTGIAEFELISKAGETCIFNHKRFVATGHLNAAVIEPTKDSVLKEFSANTGAGELEIAGEEASLKASVSLKLSLGFAWGVT